VHQLLIVEGMVAIFKFIINEEAYLMCVCVCVYLVKCFFDSANAIWPLRCGGSKTCFLTCTSSALTIFFPPRGPTGATSELFHKVLMRKRGVIKTAQTSVG
jgi:hypothetical protein